MIGAIEKNESKILSSAVNSASSIAELHMQQEFSKIGDHL